ncbi:MAG: hypothetical protein N2Z21_07560 [Candidatus Sumerlaeaceae bacterium]|nr:hypothetical protein [Candidatus Sumerlaeaceae bacterium]
MAKTLWTLSAVVLGIILQGNRVSAVETKVLRDDSFQDFYRGETTGTEILAEGKITIGPLPKRLTRTDDAIAWKVVLDRYDKNLFIGTGHEGKVWRLEPDGKLQLWADLDEIEVTALAVDFTGGVLVGASPSGKIYRVVQAGNPELFFDTKEQHVWDMIFDRDGVLYVATGPHGKIFRIRGPNNGEVYYDTHATNVMGLAFDGDGALLAATQGKAYVLRIPRSGSATVLYAASEDECRALTVDRTGNIYVAVNSARLSSVLERLRDERAMSSASATATPSSAPQQSTTQRTEAVREILSSMTTSLAGLGGQSTIVKIEPSGFASTFWNSPDAPIHALAADLEGTGIYVAAGSQGKIYRLRSDTNYSLVADVEEQSALSFTAHNGHIYFATVNRAAAYVLGDRMASAGLYASRPLNAGSIVSWGNVMLEADIPEGSTVSLEVRAGNTSDPSDKTWGEWQKASAAGESLWKIPPLIAQYLQYRLRLQASPSGASPTIDALQFFYVQRNAPPILKSIKVEKVGGEPAPPSAQPQPSSTPRGPDSASMPRSDASGRSSAAPEALLSVLAGAKPPDPAQPASQPPAAALGAQSNSSKFAISWEANDPNGDKLVFRLALKGEDESEWKVLEKELSTTRYTLDTSLFADGRYRFMVEASDRPQNPDDVACTASIVSRMFAIDNTPPAVIKLVAKRVAPNTWRVEAEAADELSILASASYCVDTETVWFALLPADGIFDSEKETFRFDVEPKEKSPEHIVRLRVLDREGNAQVAKIVLQNQ